MTENYIISYSQDALDDLREIYSYIANVLLVPETAAGQVGRIRKEVRSLNFMPARYALVEWEPWHSMGMHQLPVDNFMVYYLGYLAGINKGKECSIVIISKDTGFDNVIKFWKAKTGIKSSRAQQIKGSTPKAPPTKVAEPDKTSINNEIMQLLSKAGFECKVVGYVASQL